MTAILRGLVEATVSGRHFSCAAQYSVAGPYQSQQTQNSPGCDCQQVVFCLSVMINCITTAIRNAWANTSTFYLRARNGCTAWRTGRRSHGSVQPKVSTVACWSLSRRFIVSVIRITRMMPGGASVRYENAISARMWGCVERKGHSGRWPDKRLLAPGSSAPGGERRLDRHDRGLAVATRWAAICDRMSKNGQV
jgi:hypothetical protein